MRKMFRTFVFGVIIATPLLLAPHKSQAGIIQDVLSALFGKNDKKTTTPPNCTTSVPLNEGEILLIIAGLGLGAKMLYDRHRKQTINSVI